MAISYREVYDRLEREIDREKSYDPEIAEEQWGLQYMIEHDKYPKHEMPLEDGIRIFNSIFDERYENFVEELMRAAQNSREDCIYCYRIISIADDWDEMDLLHRNVGIWWSTNPEGADVYGVDHDPENQVMIMLEGDIPLDHVNLTASFNARLSHPEEHEIQTFPGANIFLYGYRIIEEKRFEHSDFNSDLIPLDINVVAKRKYNDLDTIKFQPKKDLKRLLIRAIKLI